MTEPSANSLLTDYYPSHQRGRAFSIQQLMLFVGFGAGIGLGGAVGNALGWRWAFVVVGAPGCSPRCSSCACGSRSADTATGSRSGIESSLDEAHEEQPAAVRPRRRTFVGDMVRGLRDDVKIIMQIPTLRFVLVGVGVLLFSVTGIGYWLPVYHERFSGLTMTEATAPSARSSSSAVSPGRSSAACSPTGTRTGSRAGGSRSRRTA